MPDQDKELEKLAARGRKSAAREAEAAAEKRQQVQTKRGRQRDRLVDRSLGLTPGWRKAVDVGSMFLAIVGLSLGVSLAAEFKNAWPAIAGVGIALLGGGLVFWARVLYRNGQRRWLERLPFEFDLEGYFAQLRVTAYHRNPQIEATFREAVDPALAETICAAVRGALADAEASFRDPATLTIRGPKLATWVVPGRKASTASTKAYYDNSRVHQFFRRCVEKALTPVAKRAPIQRVAAR